MANVNQRTRKGCFSRRQYFWITSSVITKVVHSGSTVGNPLAFTGEDDLDLRSIFRRAKDMTGKLGKCKMQTLTCYQTLQETPWMSGVSECNTLPICKY
jgi:hypothetical protein